MPKFYVAHDAIDQILDGNYGTLPRSWKLQIEKKLSLFFAKIVKKNTSRNSPSQNSQRSLVNEKSLLVLLNKIYTYVFEFKILITINSILQLRTLLPPPVKINQFLRCSNWFLDEINLKKFKKWTENKKNNLQPKPIKLYISCRRTAVKFK